jgi:RNA polymerase sigma factor (sigma-70 family)
MMMDDDMSLVREFAASRSEAAFAALVERHLGLVHSSALRQAQDSDLAGEITQAVFLILARKAASLGPQTILSAWLCRTTRYAAADAVKARHRRRVREQEAYLQSTLNRPDDDAWERLAPLLDDALAELGGTDRAALVLRYFENKTAREIAGALRMEEGAAQKRVVRALEKLRASFIKRGVTLTATAIAGAVAANSVQAAPTGMAVTVAAAATGTAVGGSTLTILKGALKVMAWAKVKTAVVASGGALLLAAGTTAFVLAWAPVYPPGSTAWQIQGEIIYSNATWGYANKFILQLAAHGAWHLTELSSGDKDAQAVELACDGVDFYTLSHGAAGGSLIKGRDFEYYDSGRIISGSTENLPGSTASLWWLFCSPYSLGISGEGECPGFYRFSLPDNTDKPGYFEHSVANPLPRLGLESAKMFISRPKTPDELPAVTLATTNSGVLKGIVYPKTAVVIRYDDFRRGPDGSRAILEKTTIHCEVVARIPNPTSVLPVLNNPTQVTDERTAGWLIRYVGTHWATSGEVRQMLKSGDALVMPSFPRWVTSQDRRQMSREMQRMIKSGNAGVSPIRPPSLGHNYSPGVRWLLAVMVLTSTVLGTRLFLTLRKRRVNEHNSNML